MQLSELVSTSEAVTATRSRTRKVELLATLLARMEPSELAAGVAYLSGRPRQDRLEVGWATIRDLAVSPADTPTLTISEVDTLLQDVADAGGEGARARRLGLLTELLGGATAAEQRWLQGLLLRELRQGALGGLAVQAIAQSADVPEDAVRRAVMLSADPGEVAAAARQGGAEALAAFHLEIFRPVQPMLARPGGALRELVDGEAEVVIEVKLDGARVQVHRAGDEVRVYTRNLNEITDRVPEAVSAALACDATTLVLDGEVIALHDDGTPQPFQQTMSRFGREHGVETTAAEVPLHVAFFDVLHADGDLLDEPLRQRMQVLARVVPGRHRVAQLVTADPGQAAAFVDATLARRHEGVMIKDLAAPYEAGRRGAAWRKLKPTHSLDLVVLAAEWGSGRRRGWLSNLHLGAYDPEADDWVMLGKTFKGLTDAMLAWQTERLQELEVRRTRSTVFVAPDLVVEIELDGVQTSTRYPGGLALRFARVKGYREDKDPREADTIQTLRAIHAGRLRPRL